MIMSDAWIIEEHRKGNQIITPFHDKQVKEVNGRGVLSYGVSSYGYDCTCAPEFKLFVNDTSAIIDPKELMPETYIDVQDDYLIMPPNSFALSRTNEYFKIPRDILVIYMGKSTYARVGVVINVTPLEPEWEGHVTLEFSNTTNNPVKIYANEGIAQVIFLKGDRPCDVSYADRKGKYQKQKGITLPKI